MQWARTAKSVGGCGHASAGADIILTNHTDWDRSKINLPLLARGALSGPNPYIVGNVKVLNLLKVAKECATARLDAMN
jgi:hypothetical protein